MLCALVLFAAADCSRHRPADGAAATQAAQKRKFGESCTERNQCESGICLATTGGQLRCSKECRSDGECSSGWRCDQLFGSAHGQLCVAR
jgi:hypothetical protein